MSMLRIFRNTYYYFLNQKKILAFALKFYKILSKFLSKHIKTKRNLVIFGGMNGIYYGDNSKFVFEYMVMNLSHIECCWLTNNFKVYKDLRRKKLPVALSWTFKGILKLYQAHIGVYSNTLRDITFEPLFVPNTLKLVALRHGKSVKRVLYGIKDFELKEKPYRIATIKKEHSQVVFTISSSSFVSRITEKCMKIGLEKHLITGYPRYDDMLRYTEKEKKSFAQVIGGKCDHLILYAPTWRNGLKETKFFPFQDFDEKRLIKFLKENNARIAVRPHANDLIIYPNIKKYIKSLEVKSGGLVFLASHKDYPNTYQILKNSTILVTDYSSIYHDYLLLNRPIFFIPYDYEWFANQFGFIYDYFDKIPGGNVTDANTLIRFLKRVFDGNDDFKQVRSKLRDEVHTYKDLFSSKRVANEVAGLTK